jgi:hypothetical protein
LRIVKYQKVSGKPYLAESPFHNQNKTAVPLKFVFRNWGKYRERVGNWVLVVAWGNLNTGNRK